MHLVLAPRRRLATLAGTTAPATLDALDAALAARSAAGFAATAYDPEEGLPELGVSAAEPNAGELLAQIRAAAEALALRGDIIESLWIVGGPQAVPFASLVNPMPDGDGPLRGDSPYGLASVAEPLLHWPVGRTPGVTPERPGFLAAQLRRVAAAHAAGPRQVGSITALAAARWASVTEELLGGLPSELTLAPPLSGGEGGEKLKHARTIYCNLHGVRGGDAWYGEAADDSELLAVLRPAMVARMQLAEPLVVTQACFGARLDPAGEGPTMATALLAAGARGIYGALGLTYGAPDPPPGESDLLARALLRELQQPQARLGAALVAAQAATLREMLGQQGMLGPDDLKTLLGFLLYGDPLVPA
jgi:hypothetical protein